MYEIELEAGRVDTPIKPYVAAFPIAEKLGIPVHEVAPYLGLPSQRWYWVAAAQVMLKAEALVQEARERKRG